MPEQIITQELLLQKFFQDIIVNGTLQFLKGTKYDDTLSAYILKRANVVYRHSQIFVKFKDCTKERVKNALAFLSYNLPEDRYNYFNKMLDYVINDDNNEDSFMDIIRTDEIYQVLYELISNNLERDMVKSNGLDAHDYIDAMTWDLEKLKLHWIVLFLSNNKLIRNNAGQHYNQNVNIKLDERKPIVKELLFTYIGVVYAFLVKNECIDEDFTQGVCSFSLFYDEEQRKNFRPAVYIKGSEEPLEPEVDTTIYRRYNLFKNEEYVLFYSPNGLPTEIKSHYIKCLFPICIVENGKVSFFHNKLEIQDSVKGKYFTQRKLQQIEQNTRETAANTRETAANSKVVVDLLNKDQLDKEDDRKKAEENEKLGISRRIRISLAIQFCFFLVALVVLLWCVFNDASLMWVTNKFLLIGIVILAILGSVGLSIYASSLLKFQDLSATKVSARKERKILPFTLTALSCGAWAVSFMLIPNKTTASFIKNYDFSRHGESQNKKVVEYMEALLKKQSDNEGLLMQLANYYFRFDNNQKHSLELIAPLKDVKKYPEGAIVAADVLLESKKYDELKDLLDEYKEIHGANPIMLRIEGITHLFGYGREQNQANAIKCLNKAAYDGGDDRSFYYLGYALSHDLINYHEGEIGNLVDGAQYDLAIAAYFFRLASLKGNGQASLALGRLYADVNVKDSAISYFAKAIEQSKDLLGLPQNKRINLAAEFQLGLILERTGQQGKEHLRNAKHGGYEPALLYYAMKEGDHKTAIERYRNLGKYNGYKYIPPVFFEYLAVGDSTNALNSLQETHPKDRCDMDFVSAVQRIIGTPFVAKDSLMAQQLMRSSANQGCLFAKMFCLFCDMEAMGSTNSQHEELERISQNIPLGYSLDSWLYQKKGKYLYEAALSAGKALRHGHPSGALMLTGISPNELLEQFNIKGFWLVGDLFESYQKSLRMIPNNQQEGTIVQFKKSCINNCVSLLLDYANSILNDGSGVALNFGLTTPINIHHLNFWIDVLIANHCYDAECLLIQSLPNMDREYKKKLLMDAFDGVTPSTLTENLEVISTYTNNMGHWFVWELAEKYKYDEFKLYVLNSDKYNKGKGNKGTYSVELTSVLKLEYPKLNIISDESVIREISGFTCDDFDYEIVD